MYQSTLFVTESVIGYSNYEKLANERSCYKKSHVNFTKKSSIPLVVCERSTQHFTSNPHLHQHKQVRQLHKEQNGRKIQPEILIQGKKRQIQQKNNVTELILCDTDHRGGTRLPRLPANIITGNHGNIRFKRK